MTIPLGKPYRVKVNPATALPWEIDPVDSNTHNRPTRFWETGINNGTVPVADSCGASQTEARQDAAYIVHAANAYPKLIAKIKALSPNDPLLQELGE